MANSIKIEGVSKQYRLGQIGMGSLRHDFNKWWCSVRGKENPYLKISETNDRTQKSESQYVWSLKDISLEFGEGDAIGIIGRNGAGKSTLLKILSRVTAPTLGSFKVKGRIASLLEVGTGFHPELSGRENIYLNGAILGMRKLEIKRKFDEIVDFAGVERYIDTPVKRYSSGMYVRLAFAVAAHLESEILIVDEVLAVGDIEFQKKCLGKMGDISKGEGRTVLFVSHNMESIEALTQKTIYLKNGLLHNLGNTNEVIRSYIQDSQVTQDIKSYTNRIGNGKAKIVKVEIYRNGKKINNLRQGESFDVLIGINCIEPLLIDVGIVIENHREQPIFCTHLIDSQSALTRNGYFEVMAHIQVPYLRSGKYLSQLVLSSPDRNEYYDDVHHFPLLTIIGQAQNRIFPLEYRSGDLYFDTQWTVISN